jgi:hypothetical protein
MESPTELLDFRDIRAAIEDIKRNEEHGLDGDLVDMVQELGENPSRREVQRWFSDLNDEYKEKIGYSFSRYQKRHILNNNEHQLDYISIESTGIDTLSKKLTLTETSYYDSYFNFTNNSFTLLKLRNQDGLLFDVYEEAESAEDAENKFKQAIENRNFGDAYKNTVGELPSPIVGNLDISPTPRFAVFEDLEHFYIEYWSLGEATEVFNGNEGTSFEYQPRRRSAARIHLDTGHVEVARDKNTQSHMDALKSSFSSLCIDEDETASDGGVQILESPTGLITSYNVTSEDATEIIEDMGVITTYESFQGRNATITLSSVKARDVEESFDSLDDIKENYPLQRAHIKILVEDLNSNMELIDPDQIESNYDFEEDVKIGDIKEELEEGGYDNVDHITIELNSNNNTMRINKKNCVPSARLELLHLLLDNLGD